LGVQNEENEVCQTVLSNRLSLNPGKCLDSCRKEARPRH